MRVVSLFSGIAGLDLGLAQAGFPEPAAFCECDSFARGVLEHRFPGVPIHEDVQTFPAYLAEDAVLVGGFPCQDISSAGKGAGLKGKRSGLWESFARIIQAARPPAVIVENVASAANRWVDQVRAALDELGYAVLPMKLSAEDVGAPHLRLRWFLVALRRDARMARRVGTSDHPLAAGFLRSLTGQQVTLDEMTETVQQTIDRSFRGVAYNSRAMSRLHAEALRNSLAGGAGDMFPTPTASRYGSSNNGDPHDGRGAYATAGKPNLWTMAKKWRSARDGTRWSTVVVTDARASGRHTTVGQGDNKMKPGLSLTDTLRMHFGPRMFLNPGFVEALMGFPVGWTDESVSDPRLLPFPPAPADEEGWEDYLSIGGPEPGVPATVRGKRSSRRIKACGNAVVPDCARVAGEVLRVLLGEAWT